MNANETKSLSMQFDLPQAPAKVWRALTEPALLAKWLMTTDMRPAVGNDFTFTHEETMRAAKTQPNPWWDGIVHCKVQEIEPQKRITYSWRGGGVDTVVTWTLDTTPDGGTLLRLEQTGFSLEKGAVRFYEGAKMGWQLNVDKRLRAMLTEVS